MSKKKISFIKMASCCLFFLSIISNVNAQTVITLGTGTTTSSAYGLVPINTYYHDVRANYLIRASEITSAGGYAGTISALALYVSAQPGMDMANFSIKLKNTSNTQAGNFDGTGTVVYTANPQTSASLTSGGWRTFNFSSNFTWDGTSNILVEMCFDNNAYVTGGGVYIYTPGSYVASSYNYADNASGCSLTNTGNYNTSLSRPQFRLTFLNPSAVLLNNSATASLTTSFAHRRGASATPKFTLRAPNSFNAVQIELNQASDFSGTSLVTTISGATVYNSNTPYDFWTTQTLTGDRTYFVRARTSSNGGSIWGLWSTQLWPYSYYPSTPYPDEGWYYTTQEQFRTGTVQESTYNFLDANNNSTPYPDDDYMQVNQGTFAINAGAGDGVYENGWFPTVNYMTMGFQNDCNLGDAISNGFPFTVNIPQGAVINSADFSVVATSSCYCQTQDKTMQLILDAHNVDNGPALSGANVTSTVTPARTTANQVINYTTPWTDNTRYTLTTVSNILQEIVNRPGWAAGNTFNLLNRWNSAFTPATKNNRCLRQADFGAATAPRMDVTFTNFKNTVRFPSVDRAIYGPTATVWNELRITDNTVGCGTCYTEYRIHDASTNAVLAGPFIRTAGSSGSQYYNISAVSNQIIYVSATMFRNNSPQIQDIWLTATQPSPLPIELADFNGECNNEFVTINWQTISELNTDYFTVQSSSDGQNWTALDSVDASGNKIKTTNYSITARRQPNENYYRLRVTDTDGKSNYSHIILVTCKNGDITVYPNPNNGSFVISGANKGDSFKIFNAQAQIIHTGSITSSSTLIQLYDIAVGAYIIEIQNKEKSTHLKMIVK